MTPKQTLSAALKLIERPSNWLQRSYCQSAKGEAVRTTSESAVSFCSAGAIHRAAKNEPTVEAKARILLMKAVGVRFIVEWNDARERTHQEIVEGFKKAIDSADNL